MRSSNWHSRISRASMRASLVRRVCMRLAPACALLALIVLVSACGSTATVTVSGGQPTATPTGSGLPTATTSTTATATTSAGAPTNTPTPAAPSYFVWTATAANSSGDYTIIDNPATNGNASAILIVMPRFNPSNVYENHAIGVWYYNSHWNIFNQDHSTIPVNASFDVKVYSSSDGAFQWTAASSSIVGDWTAIPTSLVHADSSLVLLATPDYDSHLVYDNHPLGVWFNGSNWAIFNEDSASMPANATFNVIALVASGTVFRQTAISSNISGNWTTISGNANTDGHSNAVLECSAVYNPNNVYDSYYTGVWYDVSHWTIFNQTTPPAAGPAMPQHASFDCAVYGG